MPTPIHKDSHPCFFYGSLMAPAVLDSVTRPGIDSNLCRVHAVIEGFVRHPYHNEPYPGMIASTDSTKTVEGILVFGHSAIDVFRLDRFEGGEYTRELLPVKILESVPASFTHGQQPLDAGTTVLSNVYIFTGPVKHLDLTREWDFEAFKNEQLAQWMQTSSDFVTYKEI
ncbi:MAG: hypothetical protein BYD32DRAFT_415674 [Podila humilis]|nr:MAG: hypothetical protein BYD32DRAFT_415674 [Podila humilis]